LLQRGAEICAYDPVAMPQARRALGERPGLGYADSANGALDGADALLIVTEWKEFRSPDFTHLTAALRTPLVFDGRNLFEPGDMQRLGIEYHPIGRAAP